MKATFEITDRSGFAKAIATAAGNKAARQLREVTDDAVAEANRIVSSEMVTDRPGNRRKRGHRHLEGSFSATVDWNGTFPIVFTLQSSAEKEKVKALEHGAGQHLISANGQWLFFPSTKGVATEVGRGGSIIRLETSKRPTSRARAQGYGRTGGRIKTKAVLHPGNKAYRFMERAVDRAIERAMRSFR